MYELRLFHKISIIWRTSPAIRKDKFCSCWLSWLLIFGKMREKGRKHQKPCCVKNTINAAENLEEKLISVRGARRKFRNGRTSKKKIPYLHNFSWTHWVFHSLATQNEVLGPGAPALAGSLVDTQHLGCALDMSSQNRRLTKSRFYESHAQGCWAALF